MEEKEKKLYPLNLTNVNPQKLLDLKLKFTLKKVKRK
jgi:hypothetical protein